MIGGSALEAARPLQNRLWDAEDLVARLREKLANAEKNLAALKAAYKKRKADQPSSVFY